MRVVSVTAKPFGKIADQTLELGRGLTVVYGRNGTGKSTWHAALYAGLYGRHIGRSATDVDAVLGSYRLPERSTFSVAIVVELDDGVLITVDRDLTGARPDSVSVTPALSTAPYRVDQDGLVDLSDAIGLDQRSFAVSSWLRQRRSPDELVDSAVHGVGLANPDISLAVGALLGTTEAERAVGRLERARAERGSALLRSRASVEERTGQLFAAQRQREQVQAARSDVAHHQRAAEWAEHQHRQAHDAASRRARDELRRELEDLRGRLAMHGYRFGSAPTSRDTTIHPAVAEARRELDEALAARLTAPPEAPPTGPEQPGPYARPSESSVTATDAPADERSALFAKAALDEPVDDAAVDEGPRATTDPVWALSTRQRALRAGIVAAFGILVTVVLWTLGLDVVALIWMVLATVATATAAGLLPVLLPVRTSPDVTPLASTMDRPEPSTVAVPETVTATAVSTVERTRTVARVAAEERVSRARARLATALTDRGVPAHPDDVDAQFVVYRQRCELAAQIDAKEAELAESAADQPAEPGLGLNQPEISKDLVPGQLEELHEAWRSAVEALDGAQRRLEALSQGFDDAVVTRAEEALNEARQRYESNQRLDRALERAGDLLQMAIDQASDRLRAKVEDALQVLLADIAEERSLKVSIDRQMRVHLSSDGLRSEGLLDQATVLTRVALSRHLARGDAVGPLFLDDVTSRIDEERTQHLLSALRQLARTRQVVVFAHDPTTREWALRAAEQDPSVRVLRTLGVDQPVRPWDAA